MQRVLALDVGDRRIGLAVSDALGITAQGIETYTRTGDLEKDAAYIRSVAENTAPFACCSECRATWMAAMAFSLKGARVCRCGSCRVGWRACVL